MNFVFSKNETLFLFFLYGLIGISLLGPLADNLLMPPLADFFDHLSGIIEARSALNEGQFLLRIAPSLNDGFRYPLFQFYSPLVYFIGGVFYKWIIPHNPYIVFKTIEILGLMFAGIFTYRLIFLLFNSRVCAFLSGVVYISAPYLLVNINYRGAFTEVVAQSMLPAILYFNFRTYHAPSIRTFCYAAVTWCLLALSHLITFGNSVLFIGLFFTLLGSSWRGWCRVMLAILLGTWVAAWYLAPTALTPVGALYHLRNPAFYEWLTPLASLLSFTSTKPLTPNFNFDAIDPRIGMGWPIIFAAGITAYSLFTDKIQHPHRSLIRVALILFLFLLFLVWMPLDYWTPLPTFLYITQFSYRFLSQLNLFGILLFAYAFQWLFHGKLSFPGLLLGVWLIILSTATWQQQTQLSYPYVSVERRAAHPEVFYPFAYVSDPLRIPFFLIQNMSSRSSRMMTTTEIKPYCEQKSTVLECKLFVPSNVKLIQLPILYYPKLLTITLNGNPVSYHPIPNETFYRHPYMNRLTAAIIPIPNTENIIRVEFHGLHWANYLSFFALGMLLFLFVSSFFYHKDKTS